MGDCRCPRCLVIGRPKPLTQEQFDRLVADFMNKLTDEPLETGLPRLDLHHNDGSPGA